MSASRSLLDPAVLATINRLDLRARLVVEGAISGMHRSPFHGFSVEFAAHREYVPGDELRHVDWKVWARNDRLYIKQYEEETNLRCTLVVDCSKSMGYGEGVADALGKLGYASTIAASLAFLLHRQQDAVGLATFDDAIRRHLPPKGGGGNFREVIAALEATIPDRRSEVAGIFPRLARELPPRGLVAIISDLFMPAEELVEALRLLRNRRNEVVVIHVLHRDEVAFPFTDNTRFRGLEDATQELTADPSALRKAYLAEVQAFLTASRKACAANGVDYVACNTGDHLDAVLSAYLLVRRRMARVRV